MRLVPLERFDLSCILLELIVKERVVEVLTRELDKGFGTHQPVSFEEKRFLRIENDKTVYRLGRSDGRYDS